MRRFILAVCLVASVCAFHAQPPKPQLVLDKIQIGKLPSKPQSNPFTDILKKAFEEIKISPRVGVEAQLNDYADLLFIDVDHFLIHDGYDPNELPDVHQGFSYTLIITYSGELDLTRGWLSDLSTMHRGGDVFVDYETNTRLLEVTVPIAFDDLQFTYDYSASLMGLGPSGVIDGKVSDLSVEVKLAFNSQTYLFSLEEFVITHSGDIAVSFEGDTLVDWFLNLLADVATVALKDVILLIVESVIRGGLNSAIDDINQSIDGLINPTSPAPAAIQASLLFK